MVVEGRTWEPFMDAVSQGRGREQAPRLGTVQ